MTEYIEKEALLNNRPEGRNVLQIGKEEYNKGWNDCRNAFFECICEEQSADVAPVRHGRWKLTVHSFYRDTFDESCELCVYIVANCSECSGNHPNSYQVFSKTLYAPDDADDDFRFDQKAEEEKALLEFRNKSMSFPTTAPTVAH